MPKADGEIDPGPLDDAPCITYAYESWEFDGNPAKVRLFASTRPLRETFDRWQRYKWQVVAG